MSTTADSPKKTAAERADEHAQKVAGLLVEQLRAGTAPWQRPWENSTQSDVPTNATTGKPYRGSNYIYLWATQIEKGYNDDNRWLTLNQAKSIGAQVRKGEHGTQICFPATHYEVVRKDEYGKPVVGADGRPEKVYIRYDQPRMKYYTVFHASQCDNMPPLERKAPLPGWERHQRAEAILAASGAVIKHGGNRAYYMPGLDYIQLPSTEQFASPGKYYAVALHELGHWTGHAERLNRDGVTGGHAFGSIGYAKEELRAEISSLMVGQELGIGHDPGQHAAYVKSWVQILQDDPKEILHAASDASKIQDYVMQYDLQRGREQEQEHEQQREYANEHEQERTETHQMAMSTRDKSIPASSPQRVQKWDYDGMYGAVAAEIPRGIELMAWGTEQPGFAIMDSQKSRIWFRFEDRQNPVYTRIEKALRAGEPVKETLSALVMRRGGLDVRRDVDLIIGRARDGGILISAMPQRGDPIPGWVISLDRDDAHRFANALELQTPQQRRDYAQKVEELRYEHYEMEHSRGR